MSYSFWKHTNTSLVNDFETQNFQVLVLVTYEWGQCFLFVYDKPVAQRGFASCRHVVDLFPFSLDKDQPNEDVRTRSPKIYTTRARYTTQRRWVERHFEDLVYTGVMTTFRFDLSHPNFANIPKESFFRKYWTFTQPIDVFTYEIVNGMMVISLCPGTNCLVSMSYSRTADVILIIRITQHNIIMTCPE